MIEITTDSIIGAIMGVLSFVAALVLVIALLRGTMLIDKILKKGRAWKPQS